MIKAELEDGNYIISIMNQGEDNAIKIINLKLKTKEEQKPEIPTVEMKLEKENENEKVEIDTELGRKVWYAVYNSEEPDVKIRGIAPTDTKGVIVLDGEENLEEKTGTLDEGKYIIKVKSTQGGENIIKIINLEVTIKEDAGETETDLLRNLNKNQKRK